MKWISLFPFHGRKHPGLKGNSYAGDWPDCQKTVKEFKFYWCLFLSFSHICLFFAQFPPHGMVQRAGQKHVGGQGLSCQDELGGEFWPSHLIPLCSSESHAPPLQRKKSSFRERCNKTLTLQNGTEPPGNKQGPEKTVRVMWGWAIEDYRPEKMLKPGSRLRWLFLAWNEIPGERQHFEPSSRVIWLLSVWNWVLPP